MALERFCSLEPVDLEGQYLYLSFLMRARELYASTLNSKIDDTPVNALDDLLFRALRIPCMGFTSRAVVFKVLSESREVLVVWGKRETSLARFKLEDLKALNSKLLANIDLD